MNSIDPIRENARYIVKALLRQELVIFLGAGANLCDREEGSSWSIDNHLMPSGAELSSHLWHKFLDQAESIGVRDSDDLSRVAQAVALARGPGPLYAELRDVLDIQPPPITRLHHLLAALPDRLDRLGAPRSTDASYRPLLFISTNYDDLMERAFIHTGKPFHLYTYEIEKGTFSYRSPEGKESPIPKKPKLKEPLQGVIHPVLLKIHGGLHRSDAKRDSFVITEDHYIEYLARTATPEAIPFAIASLLEERHVLFLGHALRDWNLRVILYQLWQKGPPWKSWAILKSPKPLESMFWDSKENIKLIDCALAHYVTLLDEELQKLGEERA